MPCAASARRQHAAIAGVGEVRVPRQCATTGPFSGFERQQCMGEALAWRLQFNNYSAGTIRSATCVLAQLLRQRVIDDCLMAAHAVGHAIVANHRAGQEHEDDPVDPPPRKTPSAAPSTGGNAAAAGGGAAVVDYPPRPPQATTTTASKSLGSSAGSAPSSSVRAGTRRGNAKVRQVGWWGRARVCNPVSPTRISCDSDNT